MRDRFSSPRAPDQRVHKTPFAYPGTGLLTKPLQLWPLLGHLARARQSASLVGHAEVLEGAGGVGDVREGLATGNAARV